MSPKLLPSLIKSLVLLIFLGIMLREYYTMYRQLDKMPKPFMQKESWLLVGSGNHTLPAQVQVACKLIDSLHLKDYHVIGAIRKSDDGYSIATLNQTAWPARSDSTSRNVVGYYPDVAALPNAKILLNDQGICVGRY